MAAGNHIYSSFIAGEASPRFSGRVETQQYNQTVQSIRNMLIYPQGGTGRRPGTIRKTRLTKTNLSDPTKGRLIPFYGTDGTRWQICLIDEQIDASSVTDAADGFTPWRAINVATGDIENISTVVSHTDYGTPATDDYWAEGVNDPYDFDLTLRDFPFNEIQYAQSGDLLVLVHDKMPPTIIRYDGTQTAAQGRQFTTRLFADPRQTNFSGNNTTIPYFTPFEADAIALDGSPLTSPGLKVTRSGATVSTANFKIEPVGSTYSYFTPKFAGRFLIFSDAGSSYMLFVTRYVSAVEVTARWVSGPTIVNGANSNYDTNNADSSFRIGTWGDDWGWPKTVSFFESRIVFGGTRLYPDKVWFSEIDDIFQILPKNNAFQQDADYGVATVSTDAFAATLKEDVYSEIRWMSSKKTITVGTSLGEAVMQGPDPNQTIGPTNFVSNFETPHGSSYVQSLKFENAVLFIQRNKQFLRELVFNLDENSFVAPNLNIISSHIASKSALERLEAEYTPTYSPGVFVTMVKQESPDGLVWLLDNNGTLCCMTRDRTQNIVAWHFHELADDGNTDIKPQVASISGIQRSALDDGAGAEPDELWMMTFRPFNHGAAKTTLVVEKLATRWERGPISRNWDTTQDIAPVYMDHSVFWDVSKGDAHTGIITLSHLSEGDVVSVVMDGYDLGEYTVNASFQIDISAKLDALRLAGTTQWKAIIGFNYVGRIVPQIPEVPATLGSSLGQFRRIHQMTINFYKSLGVRFGRVESDYEDETPLLEPEVMTFPGNPSGNNPPVLFSGDRTVTFPQAYERRLNLMIESFRPLPCEIAYIVTEMAVNE